MNHHAEPLQERAHQVTRRWFLRDCTLGLGGIALHSLIQGEARAATNPLAPRQPHFPPKVKRVISMFQAGAPSHLELFDYKPELKKRNGQLPPAELLKNYRAAFIKPNSALLGPKFAFGKRGQCGMELSEIIPHIGRERVVGAGQHNWDAGDGHRQIIEREREISQLEISSNIDGNLNRVALVTPLVLRGQSY